MSGRLYLVATPIGNLDDISCRAIDTLKSVDVIYCEDTRHSAKLLSHIGARARTISLHEHNEQTRIPRVIEYLAEGKDAALISDAGTPTLSDPGYPLVRACRDKGIDVIPIPGPFAAAVALSASAMTTDRFIFHGFPPEKTNKRRSYFEKAAGYPFTGVFYISPHKAARQIAEMVECFGERKAVLARELTKLHEEFIESSLKDLALMLKDKNPRGELVLVVQGAPETELSEVDIEGIIKDLAGRGFSGRSMAEELMEATGMRKREAYARAMRYRKKFEENTEVDDE